MPKIIVRSILEALDLVPGFEVSSHDAKIEFIHPLNRDCAMAKVHRFM